MIALKNCGQATVEYIFILAFAAFLGFNLIDKFKDFFQANMGSVAHVLSTHLTIGICPSNCWFDGYENRYSGSGE